MKLLFVDYQHLPMPDATGNCVERLREQLGKMGISSDVLSFRLKKGTPLQRKDDYGTIYTETTWAKRMSLGLYSGDAKWKVVLRVPLAVATRGIHSLISTPHTKADNGFAVKACGRFQRKLEQLCRENHYDWVVGASNPFCIPQIVCRADLNGAKIALYFFDPHTYNALLSAQTFSTRLKDEMEAAQKADVIFASLEHRTDWEKPPLSSYIDKVFFLPYPNLSPYQGEGQTPNDTFLSSDINLLYLGALQDQVRYPGILLKLFEHMLTLEPKLRLWLIGAKGGSVVNKQIQEGKKQLGDRLVCSGVISFPEAMEMLQQAECVVNLGNHMVNQMPSKLLDYIAAGKPILHIGHFKPDNTAVYFQQYPMSQQYYEADLMSDAQLDTAAEKAVAFIHKHQDEHLAWPQVKETMAGFTLDDVAVQFITVLTNAEQRGAKEQK